MAEGFISGFPQAGFLDFLYPSRTLAILQQLINRNRSRRDNRCRNRSGQYTLRMYSSVASEPEKATDAVEGGASSSGAANIGVPASKSTLEFCSDRAEIDLALEELFSSTETGPDHERAWHHYENLRNLSEDLTPLQTLNMLQYLNKAPVPSSSERTILLLKNIPYKERLGIYYREGVSAALSHEDLRTAKNIHLLGLRSRHQDGTSLLLRGMIEREKWEESLEIVDDFFKYCHVRRSSVNRSSIWDDVCLIPFRLLVKKAAAAANFAFDSARTGATETVIRAQQFALELITRTFTVQTTELELVEHRRLFDLAQGLIKAMKLPVSSMYTFAIHQLLDTKIATHEEAAIEYYRQVRGARMVPHIKVLGALMDNFCDAQNSTGIFQVLDDYRKHQLDIPLRTVRHMMQALSQEGDAESVHGLFKEYMARSGSRMTSVFNSILNVHHRRAEPHLIVQYFHDLQQKYGFKPDKSSFNHMITTYARVGDVNGATHWFDQLIKANEQPNGFSYIPLMQMYAKRGDLEAVQGLFWQSEAGGVKPSVGMLDSVVLALLKTDQLDKATKLVDDATQMNLERSTTQLWNHLLNAHALRGDLVGVAETHKRMRGAAVPTDDSTYSALLHSLVIKKEPYAADKILRRVIPKAGIEPNSLHYAVVMAGFLEVGVYKKVLQLYCRMVSRDIKPSRGTQNVLLRAVSSLEIDGTAQQQELLRTQAILKQNLASMDLAEFAKRRPVPFVGPNKLDDAFTSTNFSYLIFIYGKRGAFDKVRELYDQYLATSRKHQAAVDFSPPIDMLTALLVANVEARDFEEVDRCWHLAIKKGEKLSRPLNVPTNDARQVLYSRRFILNMPLTHYIRCLETQDRTDTIITTIDKLQSIGYELDSKSWNTYIQILARNGHEMLAFSLCEQYLLDQWYGWESLGHRLNIMRRFSEVRPERWEPTRRFPAYQTFVYLAAAYRKFRVKGTKAVEELCKAAPRTIAAVGNMPKLDDEWQARILRNEE